MILLIFVYNKVTKNEIRLLKKRKLFSFFFTYENGITFLAFMFESGHPTRKRQFVIYL